MCWYILCLLALSVAVGQTQGVNGTEPDAQCPYNIPGYFHRGDCNLLCHSAGWTDIIVFYVGNYAAHAATVVSQPGQSTLSSLLTILTAVFFPGGGVRSGIETIANFANGGRTNLQAAARAGALCTVIRLVKAQRVPQDPVPVIESKGSTQENPEEAVVEKTSADVDLEAPPPTTDEADLELQPKEETVSILSTKINGRCQLPKGYYLVIVPRTADFVDDPEPPRSTLPWYRKISQGVKGLFQPPHQPPRTVVASSYNIVKIIISIVQLLFAVSTLYRTQGDQLDQFGYAAFGLTVVPYLWMSFINLLANAVCPQYDTLFIVESRGLDDLRERLKNETPEVQERFVVSGTVGRLTARSEDLVAAKYQLEPTPKGSKGPISEEAKKKKQHLQVLRSLARNASSNHPRITFIAACIPIAIVGGVTRFHPGQSAYYQRLWGK
ncbi:hypothetical protein GQ53DRAFT_802918 [Thozetella sp. PMI_491]|nr:hypothetical protein GQ53DRAFT_802918 [Thozetella sp. PMI_491]